MNPVRVTAPAWPGLSEILGRHPFVREFALHDVEDYVFTDETWRRRIVIGARPSVVGGLVEIVDNNPMVCADVFAVPDPLATLGLIALAPLVRAGILADQPAILSSFEADPADLETHLAELGWSDGVVGQSEPTDLGTVLAANVFAPISHLDDWGDLDALYDEAYGRSFFVRPASTEWDTQSVAGTPYAQYDLRLTPGDDSALLTIRVMADRHGKCGATQVVHAMNIMAGFEESLGL